MTYALIIALVGTVAGHLVLLDRRDRREREERQTLLQRIQAPEVAVVDHSQQRLVEDGDGLPMSDEQIAEIQERERALAFLEFHENGDMS